MNFVLGAHGRLGSAIVASTELGKTIALDRSIYSHWACEGAADDVARYFEKSASPEAAGYVFAAAGLLIRTVPRRNTIASITFWREMSSKALTSAGCGL